MAQLTGKKVLYLAKKTFRVSSKLKFHCAAGLFSAEAIPRYGRSLSRNLKGLLPFSLLRASYRVKNALLTVTTGFDISLG